MITRLIELVNNFYRDGVGNTSDTSKALGKYCCFGYYDAMDISVLENADMGSKEKWEIMNEVVLNRLDGTCDSRNVLCLGMDDEKDRIFWKEAEMNPILFVTMIRLGYKKGEIAEYQRKLMDSINSSPSSIAYYSSSHCEIIVIRYSKNYGKGIEYIRGLRDELEKYTVEFVKMYTIGAVKEEALSEGNQVDEQVVFCRMRAVVKNHGCLVQFLEGLGEKLGIEEAERPHKMKVYELLGGSDILIELNDVQLSKLLACYKMGELLTHSNELYKDTFYNVESEIFSEEWRV